MISRHKSFYIPAIFCLFLSSILLFPTLSLRAQPACNPPVTNCDVDSECNDGNPCNGTELCFASGGVDTFSAPTCHCGTPPADNTVSCASDGTFCNGTELCVGGTCSGHTGNPCSETECNHCNENADNCFDPVNTTCTDDGNFCTTDACNGNGSCVSSPNDFKCDDGVNCTTGDVCAGGACNGTAIPCDDAIACTVDACDEPTGLCAFDDSQCECESDADCDDQNACTDEFCCLPGACPQGTPFTCIRSNNTDPCDDGIFCNGTDICSGGTCGIHSGDPCTDSEQCDETCNESADNCFAPRGTACDDGDLLTITECDGTGKCATIETFSTQGGKIGCSLNPAGGGDFALGFMSTASAFGALILSRMSMLKKKKAASS